MSFTRHWAGLKRS